MAFLNERSTAKWLYNPFALYVADSGDSQPANPSYYTEPAMSFASNREWVMAKGYTRTDGVLYTARAELSGFEFRVGFSIKETTLSGIKLGQGGTINSDSDEITLDGLHQTYALWFETCFNDNSKIVRVIVPKAKAIDSVTLSAGTAHLLHPYNFVALVDPNDKMTFPSIYIQP